MPSTANRQDEVDRNFDEFQKLLPTLLATHLNQFALMRDGKIVAFYTTARDARATAEVMFNDGIYSIQQVTNQPVDLGFFSHALVLR